MACDVRKAKLVYEHLLVQGSVLNDIVTAVLVQDRALSHSSPGSGQSPEPAERKKSELILNRMLHVIRLSEAHYALRHALRHRQKF